LKIDLLENYLEQLGFLHEGHEELQLPHLLIVVVAA
jgi:hypothetical protein